MSVMTDRLSKTLNLFGSDDSSQNTEEIQMQFRNRLDTYIEGQKWVHKPLVISPTVCARYGWKCIGSQLLECEICSAKLIPGQLKLESFQTYKACVQKVQENLKTSHKDLCPWPLTPCPESFVRMQPLHKEVALKEFRTRFESLVVLGQHLPVIKEDVTEKLGFSENSVASLLKLLSVEDNGVNNSAIHLAATGWRNEPAKPKCLSCFQCQRTISLVLYTSVNSKTSQRQEEPQSDISSSENADDQDSCEDGETRNGHAVTKTVGSPSSVQENGSNSECCPKRKMSPGGDEENESSHKIKRIKIAEKPMSYFDPVFEHRPWCPWTVESAAREKRVSICNVPNKTENGCIALPGWQLFIKCLLRNIASSEENTSPLKEQINSARNLLETWSSPA